jgi:hypothetical protein
VKDEGELAPAAETWTRVEDYFIALARRRAARRSRTPKPRTEPEAPRFLLSTLPFLTLIAGLAVLAVAIAIAAWPGGQPELRNQAQPQPREIGTAPKGWFQEAQKEFR